jgi:hypothetical protein
MGDPDISHSNGVQPVLPVIPTEETAFTADRLNCDKLVSSARNGVEHTELTQSVRNGTSGAGGLHEKTKTGSAGPRRADEYQVDFS